MSVWRQSGLRAIICEGGLVTQVYTHVVSSPSTSACPEESGGVIVTPLIINLSEDPCHQSN